VLLMGRFPGPDFPPDAPMPAGLSDEQVIERLILGLKDREPR